MKCGGASAVVLCETHLTPKSMLLSLSVAALPFGKCFSGVADVYGYLYSALGANRKKISRSLLSSVNFVGAKFDWLCMRSVGIDFTKCSSTSRSVSVKTQPTSFNCSHCTASYWHFLHQTYVHLRWQWAMSIHVLDLGCL